MPWKSKTSIIMEHRNQKWGHERHAGGKEAGAQRRCETQAWPGPRPEKSSAKKETHEAAEGQTPQGKRELGERRMGTMGSTLPRAEKAVRCESPAKDAEAKR